MKYIVCGVILAHVGGWVAYLALSVPFWWALVGAWAFFILWVVGGTLLGNCLSDEEERYSDAAQMAFMKREREVTAQDDRLRAHWPNSPRLRHNRFLAILGWGRA